MNLDTLKRYAHALHQAAGQIQADEFTSSKAWFIYRCKLVEFLFEFKAHFVQKEIKEILSNLGYHPVSYWAKKFGVSRALVYRDILPHAHVVEFQKGLKYVTFEIGYTYIKGKPWSKTIRVEAIKRPVGRPKKLQFNQHQY